MTTVLRSFYYDIVDIDNMIMTSYLRCALFQLPPPLATILLILLNNVIITDLTMRASTLRAGMHGRLLGGWRRRTPERW